MEPVPETERMEAFRASPVPHLRIQESSLYDNQSVRETLSIKPPTLRRSTDPTPHSPRSPLYSASSPSIPYRPRNTSPYSRGHLRSKSSTGSFAPPMSRTQSLPGSNAAGQLLISPRQRPASPVGSPNRVRTPRKPVDEIFPGFLNRGLRDISETGSPVGDDQTPKATERSTSPSFSNSYKRHRRPASPLRYITQSAPTSAGIMPTTPSTASSASPSYQSVKFTEPFLGSGSYTNSFSSFSYPGSFSSSSVPSTPTSARSRSPSISSLETIPDSPDAEEAALEAERIAQLKADADAADGGDDAKARAVIEAAGSRGRTLGFGSRDKRKRWSVCGAERRGDLNLDTIWED